MQIVIDIDEKLVCEGFERQFTEEERNILIRAIGNGIPLPKGHGDLVDADKVILGLVYGKHIDKAKCGEITKIFDNAVVIPADKGE